MSFTREEIFRFDPSLPLEKAKTPPSSWYTHPDFFRFDQDRVFKNEWVYAGRTDQLRENGSYFTGEYFKNPYVVVRTHNGELKAFYNICRHHATCLAIGEGKAKRLTCRYHGWTYELTGELYRAPSAGEISGFKQEELSLRPIACETWKQFVFIHFGTPIQPLPFRSLEEHFSGWDLHLLEYYCQRRYSLDCNWKVYVDNYLDGGYHVSQLHRGLAAQLNLQSYKTEVFEKYVLQTCGGSVPGNAKNGDFSERTQGGALYAWVYPNLMINRYGRMMDTNWVIPISENKTEVVFDYYFMKDTSIDFRDKCLIPSDRVQQEDGDICKDIQKGLESWGFDVGPYAPNWENAAYAFHTQLSRDYRRYE